MFIKKTKCEKASRWFELGILNRLKVVELHKADILEHEYNVF